METLVTKKVSLVLRPLSYEHKRENTAEGRGTF